MKRVGDNAHDGERRLVRLHRSLGSADRDTLLAFGEFLASRSAAAPVRETSHPLEPAVQPRPPEESVVAAIKRLART